MADNEIIPKSTAPVGQEPRGEVQNAGVASSITAWNIWRRYGLGMATRVCPLGRRIMSQTQNFTASRLPVLAGVLQRWSRPSEGTGGQQSNLLSMTLTTGEFQASSKFAIPTGSIFPDPIVVTESETRNDPINLTLKNEPLPEKMDALDSRPVETAPATAKYAKQVHRLIQREFVDRSDSTPSTLGSGRQSELIVRQTEGASRSEPSSLFHRSEHSSDASVDFAGPARVTVKDSVIARRRSGSVGEPISMPVVSPAKKAGEIRVNRSVSLDASTAKRPEEVTAFSLKPQSALVWLRKTDGAESPGKVPAGQSGSALELHHHIAKTAALKRHNTNTTGNDWKNANRIGGNLLFREPLDWRNELKSQFESELGPSNVSEPSFVQGVADASKRELSTAVSGTESNDAGLDLAQLADQVYERLVRRLQSERERRGF